MPHGVSERRGECHRQIVGGEGLLDGLGPIAVEDASMILEEEQEGLRKFGHEAVVVRGDRQRLVRRVKTKKRGIRVSDRFHGIVPPPRMPPFTCLSLYHPISVSIASFRRPQSLSDSHHSH